MAVEAALGWYKSMRETEDLKTSISDQISELCRKIMEMEESEDLSDPGIRKKLGELEDQCDELSQRHWQVDFETGPKPDFSAMTEAERAEAADKLRSDELQYARRLQADGDPSWRSVEASRILDFDPKQGGRYYNRHKLTGFDLDEESPIGPMRRTDYPVESKNYALTGAVNFLSVKVASSDVGFPIHVYGTVIVRDSIDERCVYHYRRDADHCQLITSEDESLILTGPKRGLQLCGYMYVEIDLKIKDHLGQPREFSKGLLRISGPTDCSPMVSIKTKSLATRLSTMDVTYAFVNRALEGFIAVEVLQGGFHGKISAYTTSLQDHTLLLYDSKQDDAVTAENCGDIQLMRSVVSVHVKDFLIIVAQTSDGKSESIQFTPMINGRDEGQLTVGVTEMRMKLAWSVID